MNKFNKSKVALLMALTSALQGSIKTNASLVGDVLDTTAFTTSNLTASLVTNTKNKAVAIPLGIIFAVGVPIGLIVIKHFYEQAQERKELAGSILSNLKKEFETVNTTLGTINKPTKDLLLNLGITEKEAKIDFSHILELNLNNLNLINFDPSNLGLKSKDLSYYVNTDNGELKPKLGDELRANLFALALLVTVPLKQLTETLSSKQMFSKSVRDSEKPLSIILRKNEQGKLSTIWSMNFRVTDYNNFTKSNDVSLRFDLDNNNKLEISIDGHSYDADEIMNGK